MSSEPELHQSPCAGLLSSLLEAVLQWSDRAKLGTSSCPLFLFHQLQSVSFLPTLPACYCLHVRVSPWVNNSSGHDAQRQFLDTIFFRVTYPGTPKKGKNSRYSNPQDLVQMLAIDESLITIM